MSRETVQLLVSPDIAEVLVGMGLATRSLQRRSSVGQFLVENATGLATIVTLAQGPLTAAQISAALRMWWKSREAVRSDRGILIMRSPVRGEARVPIDSETDIERLAAVVHEALFPRRPGGSIGGLTDGL